MTGGAVTRDSATAARRLGAALVGLLLSIPLLATAASAQEETPARGWALDARAGITTTVGEMRNLSGPGPTLGAGVAYWLNPNVAIRGDVDAAFLGSEEPFGPLQEVGPKIRLWHTTAGVLLRFTTEELPRWTTLIGVGAGATTFDTDPFLIPVSGQARRFEFGDTYFSSYARLRIGYEVSEDARISLGIRSNLILTDEEATEIFQVATDGRASAFGTTGSFPVTLGVSLEI